MLIHGNYLMQKKYLIELNKKSQCDVMLNKSITDICYSESIENLNNLNNSYLFKRQPHKMVKHTQATCRLLSTNYLSVFYHFVGYNVTDSPALISDEQTRCIKRKNIQDTLVITQLTLY